jgi:hypothetical protein
MASDQPVTVPASLHVNEATLELLERRIEANVKASFFKSVGAPVGLAGLVAIAYTLFSWIPGHISSFLEKDPAFRNGLKTAAESYLLDPERGQRFVREQIEVTTRAQIPAVVGERVRAEVAAYFGGAEGKKLVAGQVTESVGVYFKTTGQAALQQQVASHLSGEDVKRLIREQVKRELAPGVASLLDPVMKNTRRQVSEALELENVLKVDRRPGLLEKSSVEDLQRQLDSAQGRALRDGTKDVAMTKTIRRGRVYDPEVIGLYLDTLEQKFGARFRHVVILDSDGGFLARVEPGLFRQRLGSAREPLMRVLNAEGRAITPAQVQAELNRLFGMAVDVAILPGVNIRDALRDGLWQRAPRGEAVVLLDGRRFMGTTTRDKLIDAVLQPLG